MLPIQFSMDIITLSFSLIPRSLPIRLKLHTVRFTELHMQIELALFSLDFSGK
jgi:hypothetical protein